MVCLGWVNPLWVVAGTFIAGCELRNSPAGYRVAPLAGDLCCWLKNKIALAKGGVGDGEAIGGPYPAAPQDDVEIKHARGPAASVSYTEIAFYLLQMGEQGRGHEARFYERGAIGIGAL